MVVNLKRYCPDAGSVAIVKSYDQNVRTGWKDTRLYVPDTGDASDVIDQRKLSKALVRITKGKEGIPSSIWFAIAHDLLTRGNKPLPLNVVGQYTSASAPNVPGDTVPVTMTQLRSLLEGKNFTDDQLAAVMFFVIGALSNGAGIITFQGRYDELKTEKRLRGAMSQDDIDEENLINIHATAWRTAVMDRMPVLRAKLYDRRNKTFNVSTVAEELRQAWLFYWSDVAVDLKDYSTAKNAFLRVVSRLVRNIHSLPTGINGYEEAGSFLKFSNYLIDIPVDATGDLSIPDAKRYLAILQRLDASDVTKLSIVPSTSLADKFKLTEATFGSADLGNRTVCLSLNTTGAENVKLGMMRSEFADADRMYLWTEDQYASMSVSTFLSGVLAQLNKIVELWLRARYAVAINTNDIVDLTSFGDADYLKEMAKIYLVGASKRLYFKDGDMYFGIERDKAKLLRITDRRITNEGPTSRDLIKCLCANLSAQEGTQYLTHPNPFYSAEYRTYISANKTEFSQLPVNKAGTPVIKFTTFTPDGIPAKCEIPLAQIFPNTSDLTSARLTNLALAVCYDINSYLLSGITGDQADMLQPYAMAIGKEITAIFRNTFKDVITTSIFMLSDEDKRMESYDFHRYESLAAYDLGIAMLDFIYPKLGALVSRIYDIGATNDDQLLSILNV